MTGDIPQCICQRCFPVHIKIGQDALLVGFPGPLRRCVVLEWAHRAGRLVEYVALTPDTTDAELKLTRGGRTLLHFPVGMDRKGRIARAFGRDLREELLEVSARTGRPVIMVCLTPL